MKEIRQNQSTGKRTACGAHTECAAFWCIAAIVVLYLGAVCHIKDLGYAMFWAAAAASAAAGIGLLLFERFGNP